MSRAAAHAGPTTWRDRKRYLWLFGLLVPTFPFLGGLLAWLSGWGVFWYLGPVLLFLVIPVIDLLAGFDRSNPPDDVIAALEQDRYYRWITYLFLPLQYLGLVWAAWLWTYGDLSWFDRVGLAVTVGTVAGVAINTAHELGHKRDRAEKWLAKIALAQTGYGHFFIEHNRGHHSKVATPDDPASARLGENVYVFLPRTILGGLRSSWRLEQPRFHRRNQSHWNLANDVLNAWLMTVVLWAALLAVFGLGLLPFLLVQAATGVVLLEIVNYLEHYGLRRQRTDSGRWERVRPEHSWNSNEIATNVLLYHLQRHSDHHANPTRRYQALRDDESAPVLPTGYAGMILLAVIPPLWFRVMDDRVVDHYDGDVQRANLYPRRSADIVARYPTAATTRTG